MMNRIILFLIAVFMIIPQISTAEKIFFKKKIVKFIHKKENHPLQRIFNKIPKHISKSNKLLCLLVDFQEDDNPQTTGNGKFLTKEDAKNYPVSLGKPPHDYYFYLEQLKALKYYYLAASFGALDLQYDLFPKPESGKVAYTLPHEMAYYNPTNASQELMIERFEEYFHDIFTEADKDPAINFADYGHYMVIHAGSDWQHDILGDTPSDIPSFFIRVSEDKKVWVDNHSFYIDHTCNVPETITQDIQILDNNGIKEIYGYGVINAVMAHEFGHSLGFVDLYSTTNYRPGVGMFDIMDSGGSGLIGLVESDTTYYYIEGGLPVLPSAWHRILAWEDNFRERGILKDIYDFSFDEKITINPAEKPLPLFGETKPYFIKVPITDKEYFLLENRQIDPDGDGGTAVKSTSDKRVILYPIHYNTDPNDTLATYEYDFLLPGWISEDSKYYGGGILIWHIDDKMIYDDGSYEENTVNKDFYHRGIRLIEADNILDIGNIHSRYWLGTQYEPFFKYKPILQNGYFLKWDDRISTDGQEIGIFNNRFSALSKPAMLTNDNKSSCFQIYDISSYSINYMEDRKMNFKFGVSGFDKSDHIHNLSCIKNIGPINNVGYLLNEYFELPVVTEKGFTIYSYSYNEWLKFDISDDSNISYISIIDYYDNSKKYLLVSGKKIEVLGQNPVFEKTYSDSIINIPIYLKDYNEFVVPTASNLYIGNDSLNIKNAKCYYDSKNIVAISNGEIFYINPQTHNILSSYNISSYESNYGLVSFVDTLNNKNDCSFIVNSKNEIIKLTKEGYETIFDINNYTSQKSSQLSLFDNSEGRVFLGFGAGNKAFAISLNGALSEHFPSVLNYTVKPYSYAEVYKKNGKTYLFLISNGNYKLAIGLDGYFYNEQSTILPSNFFEVDYTGGYFLLTQKINDNDLIVSRKHTEDNPILWNSRKMVFYGNKKNYEPSENAEFSAYVFPNPSKDGFVKFRVFNSKSFIQLELFNSAGSKIFSKKYESSSEIYKDITISTKNWASGVYYAIVKSKKNLKKITFAIEK